MQVKVTLGKWVFLAFCLFGSLSQAQVNGTSVRPVKQSFTFALPEEAGEVVLESSPILTNLDAQFDMGYLVVKFVSLDSGHGSVTVKLKNYSPETATLEYSSGAAALIIAPNGRTIYRLGELAGQQSRVCGPQGALCSYAIAELPLARKYPCGPQGSLCSSDFPVVTLDF